MSGLKCQSTESLTLEQAELLLERSATWVEAIMLRLKPYLPNRTPLRVLDVGCAQGRSLIALAQRGYRACGVEPWDEAREVAVQLARQNSVTIDVRAGRAENIPFQDASFDVVLAMSVMEHVEDLEQSLSEINRVLCPGGLFWFNSASALCPFQQEISGFPLFGWYPDVLKRRIMLWARDNRPELIGHTETPAIHWWTPRKATRMLREAGFDKVWNRWQLRDASEVTGLRKPVFLVARQVSLVQYLGDIAISGCSYLARKP